MVMNPRRIDPKTRQLIVTNLVPSLAVQVRALTIYTDQLYYTNDTYVTDQTLTDSNSLILVNSTGHVTITLPSASSSTGTGYTIKNIGTGRVSIETDSNDTIDGEDGLEFYTQYEYVTITSNGIEWFIIGGEFVKMTETLTGIKSELEKMNENQGKIAWLLGQIRDAELDATEAEPDLDNFELEQSELLVDIDG